MTFNRASGSFWVSHIPNLELLVITNGCENVLIEVIPSDVLYNGVMGGI